MKVLKPDAIPAEPANTPLFTGGPVTRQTLLTPEMSNNFSLAIVNFSAGLTHLRFRDMAVGTVVGAAPKVFAWTALGGNLTDLSSPEARVALGMSIALAVAVTFVPRLVIRNAVPRVDEAADG